MKEVDLIDDVLNHFTNGDAGVTVRHNSLNTARLPNGNTALLSYDSARIAELTGDGDVIIYEGHYGLSQTTSGHLNRIAEYVNDDRIVRLSSSPIDGTIPPTFEYVDNYVGSFEDMSPVEQDAYEDVRSTMNRRLSHKGE